MTPQAVFLVTENSYLLNHWRHAVESYVVHQAGPAWPRAQQGLVFLDLDIPTLPAWTSSWWHEQTKSKHIIALTTYPAEEQGLSALTVGCCGYDHALASITRLRKVLDVVAAGGIWAGTALFQRLRAGNEPAPVHVRSTPETWCK